MPSIPSASDLFEHASCGLLVTDRIGMILKVNATFAQWFGYLPEDLENKLRIHALMPMGSRIFFQTHCESMLQRQGSFMEAQMDMMRIDGSLVPVLINAVRHSRDDAVHDELAIFIATERQQYERELRRAREEAERLLRERSAMDRRKDEFLATLSHELRNPLAPMRNMLEILKIKESLDPTLLRATDVFDRQITQMTHLVDDLMDVSRITQGQLKLRRQPVDVNLIVKDALEAVRPIMERMAHALSVTMPEQELIVNVDATRITQVLTNLLNNAAKYTPDGGLISVAVDAADGELIMTVRDSGIGIAESDFAKIFEMFAQLVPSLDRTQGGLGVGLAIVRGIVALHGGSIVVDSAGAGRGSVFTVRLPSVISKPIFALNDATLSTVQGQRLLVVDDNVDAADSLSMAMEMLGYDVRTAYNGLSGVSAAAEFVPTIVLLDIGMPDINGYEVARRIRTETWGKSMSLIAATGWGQEEDKKRAMEAGFDHHLTKPIDFTELDKVLSKFRK